MIRIRLFAALADAAGVDRLEVAVPAGAALTVAGLRSDLSDRFGTTFAARLERSRAWVDGEDVDEDMPLVDGVEVALLPPFAGG